MKMPPGTTMTMNNNALVVLEDELGIRFGLVKSLQAEFHEAETILYSDLIYLSHFPVPKPFTVSILRADGGILRQYTNCAVQEVGKVYDYPGRTVLQDVRIVSLGDVAQW